MAAAGFTPEQIAAVHQPPLGAEGEEPFEVLPDNWPAVQVFCSCATQWRYVVHVNPRGSRSEPTGLDYTALAAAMQMMRIENPQDVFERVRVLELSALKEWRKT